MFNRRNGKNRTGLNEEQDQILRERVQDNHALLHNIQEDEREESDRKRQAAIARGHSSSRDSRYI